MRLEHPFEQFAVAWLLKQEPTFASRVAVVEGGASTWGFECRSYEETAGKPNGFWIKHVANRWAASRASLLTQALQAQNLLPRPLATGAGAGAAAAAAASKLSGGRLEAPEASGRGGSGAIGDRPTESAESSVRARDVDGQDREASQELLQRWLFKPGVLPTPVPLNVTRMGADMWPEFRDNPGKEYFRPTINLHQF